MPDSEHARFRRHPRARVARLIASGQDGFSVLELLVVIAIIGVLTSYIAPRFLGSIGKSEIQTARVQIDALTKGVESFRMDVGRYPSVEEGLTALVEQPTGEAASRWRGPYLKGSVPRDPWGNAYQYTQPGARSPDFDIVSFGRDGRPGGTGDDADILL